MQYLKILVDEVRYSGKKIEMSGSNSALANLAGGGNLGLFRQALSVISDWLPGNDALGQWKEVVEFKKLKS